MEPRGDGVFKVRTLKNKAGRIEKYLVVREDVEGEYRRFTEDDGERIYYQKV